MPPPNYGWYQNFLAPAPPRARIAPPLDQTFPTPHSSPPSSTAPPPSPASISPLQPGARSPCSAVIAPRISALATLAPRNFPALRAPTFPMDPPLRRSVPTRNLQQ